MTTITREALCPVVYCPAPTSPDWHHCAICGSNTIHHHHVEPRGAGGSPSRKMNKAGIAPLCPKHHEEVTLHKWEDEIQHTPLGAFYIQKKGHRPEDVKAYKIEDHPALRATGEVSEEPPISRTEATSSFAPSAAGEGSAEGLGRDSRGSFRPTDDVSPAAVTPPKPATPRESSSGGEAGGANAPPDRASSPLEPDASVSVEAQAEGEGFGSPPSSGSVESGAVSRYDTDKVSPEPPVSLATFLDNGIECEPEITFEQAVDIAKRAASESRGRQWKAGDAVNILERFGERASQYIDPEDFAYPIETLSNYANIAKAFPLAERRSVAFTFHQTVYKHEARYELLDRALSDGWDRARLREEAWGAKPKQATRWSLDELRGLAHESGFTATVAFLDYLETL